MMLPILAAMAFSLLAMIGCSTCGMPSHEQSLVDVFGIGSEIVVSETGGLTYTGSVLERDGLCTPSSYCSRKNEDTLAVNRWQLLSWNDWREIAVCNCQHMHLAENRWQYNEVVQTQHGNGHVVAAEEVSSNRSRWALNCGSEDTGRAQERVEFEPNSRMFPVNSKISFLEATSWSCGSVASHTGSWNAEWNAGFEICLSTIICSFTSSMLHLSSSYVWILWLVSLCIVSLGSHLSQSTPTSRLEKRRVRIHLDEQKKQLRALLFASCLISVSGMQGDGSPTGFAAAGGGEQEFMQRLFQLTQAATNAALSAQSAIERMNAPSLSSSADSQDILQQGLSAASRILKTPDVFTGEDVHAFSSWRFQFTSWLTFGEGRYKELLERAETMSADITGLSASETALSTKLYSILTSYLRGRCSQMVRSGVREMNGLQLWRDLHREFMPSTRQRGLALAQVLATYPPFSAQKSTLESILEYERLVADFEDVSSTKYPEELKSATLLRCSEQRVREYLQLSVSETTSYKDIREALLAHEKVTKTWSQESVLKSVQEPATASSSTAKALYDPNGPAPMEVDRIEKGWQKGKGKQKGKQKGNGRGYWGSGQMFFRGRGKGGKGSHQKGKGKSKGKGKKGKSKTKNGQKGKHPSEVDQQQCRICLEYGHWANECPRRYVNQVNQAQSPQQQVFQNMPQEQPPRVPTGVNAQPAHQQPTVTSTIRRIFHIATANTAASASSSHVRMISQHSSVPMQDGSKQHERHTVILDSGSDVSLLPLSFGSAVDSEDCNLKLQNCQGGSLQVLGHKSASLLARSVDGEEIELQHKFLVGDVSTCILSLGELYRSGWSVQPGDLSPFLMSPDGSVHIPVQYRQNSFAIEASVCRIEKGLETVPEHFSVRAVMQAATAFCTFTRFGVWDIANECPYTTRLGKTFIDPRPMWSVNFPYRTTLLQRLADQGKNEWCVCEVSKPYLQLEDPFGFIPEVATYGGGEDCVILTIMSDTERALPFYGTLLDEGGLVVEQEKEAEDRPDVLGRDIPEFHQHAPVLEAEELELGDKVTIGGIELTQHSSIRDLKAAAGFLRISSSGSKTKVFGRIKDAHVTALRRRAVEVAHEEYLAAQGPKPRFQDAPVQPSEHERRQHNATHLPMKAWCPHCVAGKSKANSQHPTKLEDVALRTFPTIQCDCFFGMGSACILLLVDTWTKFVEAKPLKTKNQTTIGEAISSFLGMLGYSDEVEIAFDQEPVLAAGARVAKAIRSNNGCQTLLQPGKPYDKSRTALAERSVQTVRGQQKTLMSFVEEQTKCSFGEEHVLRSWAMTHAAWLLNRFHVSAVTGVTAFMSLRGRPYKGRVCLFAQMVYALDALQAKYTAQWRRGIWLGKDEADMDVVAVGPREIIESKAVRKTAEEWDAALLLALEIGPWDTKKGTHSQMRPVSVTTPPVPVLLGLDREGRTPDVEISAPAPQHVSTQFDEEAALVEQYALNHPDEDLDEPEVLDPSRSKEGGVSIARPEQAPASVVEKRAAEDGIERPATVRQRVEEVERKSRQMSSEADLPPAKAVRFDAESLVPEPQAKVPKLFPPSFAGHVPSAGVSSASSSQVRQVVEGVEMYHEDEPSPDYGYVDSLWDEALEEPEHDSQEVFLSLEEKENRGFFDEGRGPPEVSDAELSGLQSEALVTELERLTRLDVIEQFLGQVDSECTVLDTRVVYDWRYRDGWTYRARLVAREFRGASASSEETFSPTNPLSVIKMLLATALIHDLYVAVFDVSDAFLQVDQRELVIVEVPQWIRRIVNKPDLQYWRLKKCLPGQRNAALRWCEYFTDMCTEHSYEHFPGSTLFRHKDRMDLLSVHIDDIIQVADKQSCLGFREVFSERLKLKMEGPFGRDEPGVVYYLKRQIEICTDAIYITASSKYIPKLVELLKISDRRPRTTPNSPELDVYDPESASPGEYLTSEQSSLFRSALGVCIYVGQERFDVQHSIRILSSYMSRPTKQAMNGLRKLVSYLQYSKDMRMKFDCVQKRSSVFHRWNDVDLEEHSSTTSAANYRLEAFSDSDWASSKVSRKSTSCGVIFLNGCCVHSHCRAQQSIALSSMEAEILAATGLLTELVYMKHLLQFMVRCVVQASSNKEVSAKLYMDSTSGQQFFQRLGPGRAKHLSVRLLWSQSALRKGWFQIGRISTKWNPADLNTKVLTKERRHFLCQLFGFVSEALDITGDAVPVSKHLVARVAKVLMAMSLRS